jgi:hypothetical protein
MFPDSLIVSINFYFFRLFTWSNISISLFIVYKENVLITSVLVRVQFQVQEGVHLQQDLSQRDHWFHLLHWYICKALAFLIFP